MPLVGAIFAVLNEPADSRDTVTINDKKMLRRGYFTFIANIVSSELSDVIKNQGEQHFILSSVGLAMSGFFYYKLKTYVLLPESQNLEKILMTIVHGCTELADPTAQKTCFGELSG